LRGGFILVNGPVETVNYTYDEANRLVGVSGAQSSTTMAYNGLGDRLQQTVGGVTTHYTLDINNSLSQVLSDGTDRYLYGMGRIAQQTPNGLLYFLPDALGTVRQLADPSGGIIFAQSFDPYGNLLSSQGAAASPYGFAGEWGDAGGLIYLRARYYLPQAGIFTARDTWARDLTAKWSIFRSYYKSLGRSPTAKEILRFALKIDQEFSTAYNKFYKKVVK
jgi:RHS repeat-associated protein